MITCVNEIRKHLQKTDLFQCADSNQSESIFLAVIESNENIDFSPIIMTGLVCVCILALWTVLKSTSGIPVIFKLWMKNKKSDEVYSHFPHIEGLQRRSNDYDQSRENWISILFSAVFNAGPI